jgi:hypothetical protein
MTKLDLKVGKPGGGVDGVHDVETDVGEGMDPTLLVSGDMVSNALSIHSSCLFEGDKRMKV